MRRWWPIWYVMVLCGGVLWGATAYAAEPKQYSARSGAHTVALVELYTSEGCSSCPPADTWVSALPARGFSTEQIIPLALHVDYWDYLGWSDPFAQALFTQRQRAIAARHRSRTIYTPQLVLQGEDFRNWQSVKQRLQQINSTKARADLRLYATPHSATMLEVVAEAVVPAAAERQDAHLYVALYESNLISDVQAGENHGRTLHHSFVVRQWLGPFAIDAQGLAQFHRTLSLQQDWQRTNLGVATFVQNHRTGDILQALALPMAP